MVKWYVKNDGITTYSSSGDFGDIVIPNKPGPDYIYDAGAWRTRTQQEIYDEKDAELEETVNIDKRFKALAFWIAQLHGISVADAKTQLKAIYRTI